MNFIDSIKQRARQNIKTIVLPEASDLRIIKAAATDIQEKYANIVLVGDEDSIKAMANENNLNINEAKIVNPLKSEKSEVYANKLYELRKEKGMTLEKARELVKDEVYFSKGV